MTHKGRTAAKKDVQNDPTRPDIAFFVVAPDNDFRGNIKGASDNHAQFFSR